MDIDNPPAEKKHPSNHPFGPPSLKELATTRLALCLWNHDDRLLEHLTNPLTNSPKMEFSCVNIIQPKLPPTFIEIIDTRIHSLRKELKILFDGFVKIGISSNNFVQYFSSFTYGPDGKICHERSARNLLARDDITLLEKYHIACVYWFEEEVRRMWPLAAEDPENHESVSDVLRPILQYWNNKIINVDASHSNYLDFIMLFGTNMEFLKVFRNWAAFQWMLNTSSVHEQHQAFATFKTFGTELKYVLSKLSTEQADYVLQTYPDEIICILASDEQCFEYVMKIWHELKYSINFSTLLKKLCHQAYVCEKNESCGEKSTKVVAVLLEIWTTASYELKMEFFADDDAIKNVFVELAPRNRIIIQNGIVESEPRLQVRVCYDHDVSFYSRLFSDMPPETRTRVCHNNWKQLVIRSQSWFLNALLKLCLKDDDEIERFVEGEMFNFSEIALIIKLWLRRKLYTGMIDYCNLCTWNVYRVRGLRREFFKLIITSMKDDIKIELLIKLSESINDQISNVDEARNLKKFVFFLDPVQKHLMDRLNTRRTKKVFIVTACFLHSERSQYEKDLFLPHWGNFLAVEPNNVIEVERWLEFLSWWEGSDNWPIFKVTLPVDEIFEKLLLEVVPSLTLWLGPMDMKRSEPMPVSNSELKEFAPVDQFLMFYFENEEDAKNYKWNKMRNYEKMPGLKNFLGMNNECIVNDILRWFFNGDLIGISTFKDRLQQKF